GDAVDRALHGRRTRAHDHLPALLVADRLVGECAVERHAPGLRGREREVRVGELDLPVCGVLVDGLARRDRGTGDAGPLDGAGAGLDLGCGDDEVSQGTPPWRKKGAGARVPAPGSPRRGTPPTSPAGIRSPTRRA